MSTNIETQPPSLADTALHSFLAKGVEVYTLNGVKLSGTLLAYDYQSILLKREGSQQLVMRHAISTLTICKRELAR